MSRQFPRTAAALAAFTAGLLIVWNQPSAAQQSPDTWSAEQRAVLPSGLSVQFDLAPSPGFDATAEPGELADRAGGGRAAGLYADGTHPGDPAQTFRIHDARPQADGAWRTVGTLRLTFSRSVRNPRLHASGLAALATGRTGTTSTAARLTLTGGSPSTPALVNRTDWPGWTVDANTLAPVSADGSTDGSGGAAAEGSLELAGTFRTAVFRVEQRSTARAGSTTAPPVLRQAYTVTVDEDLGTAPQAYGNASHVVSDLFLGADANPSARRGARTVVAVRGTTDRHNVWANPVPPKLQPGRGEYQGADPSLAFPAEAAIGRYYRLTVPVAVGDQPATLAGWIDWDHSGRFDPADRVQAEVQPGTDTATLEWTVPSGAASGETWARLRIARDPAQLIASGGFADSGEVSDQRIKLTVGAARPEIAEPVDGTATADVRPRIRGEGAVAGASVEVREGDAALCRARVERGGDWNCRPGDALAAGRHSLTPVETTSGGVVLRGEPVRLTVKTVPPAAPVLTLPEYTNDPGLQLTGTGEAGDTVSVGDQSAGVRGGSAGDLCSTTVRRDGEWSCLPVENLADGRHQLTPVAVDAAGNRTAGKAVSLVVTTVPPDKPVLTVPAAGETVRTARPRLAGRAGTGTRVLVTAQAGGAASDGRVVLCGAAAAVDGSWTCTANRDLTNGEQALTVTATDLAGNAAAGDPVRVRVAVAPAPAAGAVVASPVAPSPVLPGAAVPGPVVSSPSVGPSPSAAGSPKPSASAPVSVSASRPAASVTPSTSSRASVPAGEVFVPAPAGLLPVLVPVVDPPFVPDSGASVPPSPTAVSSPSGVPSPSASASASASAPAGPGRAVTAAPLSADAARAPAGSARPLPAPPAASSEGADGSRVAAHEAGPARWRTGLAGGLLLLAAIGLITRRVFARGPGARRR
ncbi:Ig-like domain-containing protein [Kitasatospora sp. NPDC048722]|uniref:Ig-like domain-containing protein n=1 Tax=Kitasatospora sp. NPDC048722 TaxID=3155639 RepID=UPI0033C0A260